MRITIYLNKVEEEKLQAICRERNIENISTCIKFLVINEVKKAPTLDPMQLKLIQIIDYLTEIKEMLKNAKT